MGKDQSPVRPSDLLIRESVDALEAFLAPDSHRLIEAPGNGDDLFNEDGTVNVVLLRPGMGRGPAGVGGPAGRRIYGKDMLVETAPQFSGWVSYMNHDSPVARKARAGLPRPPSDLAGQLVETWWDSEVTGKRDKELGFEQGGVVAKYKPATNEAEQLIRRVPGALKFSIMGQATGLTESTYNGQRGWLVEGIEDDPECSSFDMVTKAGAGGEVKPLLESLAEDGHSEPDEGYRDPQEPDDLEGDEIDMGGMKLSEALQTDEVKGMISGLVEAEFADKKDALVETVREETRRELAPEIASGRYLRLANRARALIEAAKLPDAFATDLLSSYGVTDDGQAVVPGDRLKLCEAVVEGDPPEVKKTAVEVLEERVAEDIKRERAKLSEALPTVPFTPSPAGGGEAGAVPAFGGQNSDWARRAKDSGLNPVLAGAIPMPPAPAATS